MVVPDGPPSGAAAGVPGGPGGPAGPAHDKDASRTNVVQRLRDPNSQALASSRMLTSPAGRTPPLRTPTRDVATQYGESQTAARASIGTWSTVARFRRVYRRPGTPVASRFATPQRGESIMRTYTKP